MEKKKQIEIKILLTIFWAFFIAWNIIKIKAEKFPILGIFFSLLGIILIFCLWKYHLYRTYEEQAKILRKQELEKITRRCETGFKYNPIVILVSGVLAFFLYKINFELAMISLVIFIASVSFEVAIFFILKSYRKELKRKK